MSDYQIIAETPQEKITYAGDPIEMEKLFSQDYSVGSSEASSGCPHLTTDESLIPNEVLQNEEGVVAVSSPLHYNRSVIVAYTIIFSK